jgi:hypothetical protein
MELPNMSGAGTRTPAPALRTRHLVIVAISKVNQRAQRMKVAPRLKRLMGTLGVLCPTNPTNHRSMRRISDESPTNC